MPKRKVLVYKHKRVKGQTRLEKVCIGGGIFHQFGLDYEEFEDGVGNYTTAIVEMSDGTIEGVSVDLITFFDEKPMPKKDESQEELTHDIMVLVGRLYLENPDTFSPETLAVMERWKPRWDIEFKKLCASDSSQVWKGKHCFSKAKESCPENMG